MQARSRSVATLAWAGLLAFTACSGDDGGENPPATYGISGTVSGATVSGVTITLSGAGSGTAMTDASGNYTFTGLANGSYTLTPSKAGYNFSPASLSPTVNGADVTGQSFTATAMTYGISGTVSVVTPCGGTLSGVTIALSGAGTGHATTDGSGNYTFIGLPNATYTLTPSHADYTFSPTSLNVTVNDGDVTGQSFAGTAITYAISGTVSGATVSGVTVTLSGAGSGTAMTDASGNYTFTGLANGSYTLTPSKAGYSFSPASLSPTVNAGDVTGQSFTAAVRTYSISGNVSGASGVTINLSGAGSGTALTDASGNYAFFGLANGSYTITPLKYGYSFAPASLSPTVDGADLTGQSFAATENTYVISGTVSGATASGVTITLSGSASATAVTDASGNYAFTGLANGSYTVTPSKAGYSFGPTSLSPTVSYEDATGQDFTAVAITYGISGTVSGATVSGVTITLSGAGSGTALTDASGNYSFTGLSNGSYTLTPSKAGYDFSPASLSPTVNGANVTGQTFTAAVSTYSISGTVSGDDVSGVTITLSGAGSGTAMTDASGNYAFTGLANGSYTLTPSKAGYAFSPASLTPTVNGADVTGQSFTANANTYSISGTVSGATAPGVTITLSGAGSGTAMTDASGNYTFTGLANGSYTLTPSKAGYAFSPASLSPTVNDADVTGQSFTASVRTYVISGTVSGDTVSGVVITLSGAGSGTATTDASGNYAFFGLTNGSYTLTPSKAGYSFSPMSLSPSVNDADVTGQSFTATLNTYNVSGTVSGDTVSGVVITLSGAGSGTTITDASGNYAFFGLANGSYTLTPSKDGYFFSPQSLSLSVNDADVTGRDFTATEATYAISGTVGGDTVSGVVITLSGAGSGTATTDASGNYAFTGLSNGSYTLTPSKAGYDFSPESLSPTVNGANVTGQSFTAITRTYGISGTLGGDTVSGVVITLSGAGSGTTTTDASGNYAFTGLSNGSYTLTPSKAGYSFSPASLSPSVNDANVTGQSFTANAITYSISGTVSGATVSEVAITLSGAGSGTAMTDASGNFAFFGLSNGSYTLTPSKAGYDFSPMSLSPSVNDADVTGQSFTSTVRTYSISGTLGGDTVSGVLITLAGAGSGTVTTDDSGNYAFTGLSNGSYTLTPSKAGYTFSPPTRSPVIDGANVTGQGYTANAITYSISGTVTGATGAEVVITLSGAGSGTAMTDASGNFAFFGLSNGSYTLTPSRAGYDFSPMSLSPSVNDADVTGVSFASTMRTYGISGTVSGDTVADVVITLSGAGSGTAMTDASGHYAFTGLSNGSYTLTPSKAGYDFSPGSLSPAVNGADVTGQNFGAALRTFSISGTVSGDTASGVLVTLSGAADRTEMTDASGNYAFTGLSNGDYELTPSKAGYAFSPTSLRPTVNGSNVTGQTLTATAVFTISGTVSGDTAAGVTMTLTGAYVRTETTDASGNYTFTGVRNGDYTLTPSKDGYMFSPPSLSPTVSGADVASQDFAAIQMLYRIEGNVEVGVAGPASVYLSGDRTSIAFAGSNGDYAFSGLPNGSYVVTPADATVQPISQSVTIANATVTGVDFAYVNAHWTNWSLPEISPPNADYDTGAVAGTVTDLVTGLVWQREVPAGTYTNSQAHGYCRALSLGGWSTGWRLPTAIELESIVDYGMWGPAINQTAFPGTTGQYFWTGTWGSSGSYYWAVDFLYGGAATYSSSTPFRVRCVRG